MEALRTMMSLILASVMTASTAAAMPTVVTERASCDSYPEEFQAYINKTITTQTANVKSSSNACGNPDIRKLKVGTNASHWDVVHELDNMLQKSAGSKYPHGLVFAPPDGLPLPTGKALDYFSGFSTRVRTLGKEKLFDICTSSGLEAIREGIKADYASHKEDVKPYLTQNCEAIRKALASNTRFQRLRFKAALLDFGILPTLMKSVSDPATLSAIIEIEMAYHTDSPDNKFIVY